MCIGGATGMADSRSGIGGYTITPAIDLVPTIPCPLPATDAGRHGYSRPAF
jgi:hypothetical protein